MTDDERLVRDLGVAGDRLEDHGEIGPMHVVRALAWMVANGHCSIAAAIDGVEREVGDPDLDPILDQVRERLFSAPPAALMFSTGPMPPPDDTLRLPGREYRGVTLQGVEVRHDEEPSPDRHEERMAWLVRHGRIGPR